MAKLSFPFNFATLVYMQNACMIIFAYLLIFCHDLFFIFYIWFHKFKFKCNFYAIQKNVIKFVCLAWKLQQTWIRKWWLDIKLRFSCLKIIDQGFFLKFCYCFYKGDSCNWTILLIFLTSKQANEIIFFISHLGQKGWIKMMRLLTRT